MLIWILFKFGAQQLLKFNDGLKSKKASRFFWGVCLGMLISAMVFKKRHWFGAHYLFYGASACYILSIISYFFINSETETTQDVLDDI
ncbi:MAG: hypothetical protein HUJ25_16360 [Crocinitomicaceae bacterium]|nr:hypothetical protein [Crocinitomicaceae bacterium]